MKKLTELVSRGALRVSPALGPIGEVLRSRLVVERSEMGSGTHTVSVARFLPRRVHVPSTWTTGHPVPISLEGTLRSTSKPERLTLEVDRVPREGTLHTGEPIRLEQGAWETEILATADVELRDLAAPHVLALRFRLEGGFEDSWDLSFVIRESEVRHTVRRVELGPSYEDRNVTPVKLELDVFDPSPGDVLVIAIDERKVLEVPVVGDETPSPPRRATLNVRRDLAGIEPGSRRLALAIVRAGRSLEIWSGTRHVRPFKPRIHVDWVRPTPVAADLPGTYLLDLKGFVDNDFLVDCLVVEVDGIRAAVLGVEQLRPELERTPDLPLVRHQGFEGTVHLRDIKPGKHEVSIIATQRGAESARVVEAADFLPLVVDLAVESEDLERLLRNQPKEHYGLITLRGFLQLGAGSATAILEADGQPVDEQRLPVPGRHGFSLAFAPSESGSHRVRLVVASGDTVLFESPSSIVRFRRWAAPRRSVSDLGTLLDCLELRSKFEGPIDEEKLLADLVDLQTDRIPEFLERLRESAESVSRARPKAFPALEGEPKERRLKVLVASWETPGPHHGGGVLLQNLLKRLGDRHDVTLVHSYGIDEVGAVDVLRPHLARIVSVPRTHLPGSYRGSLAFPHHCYEVYTRELRRALELELLSEPYDLVNYEYAEMGPYVVSGFPSVLTIHEVGHTALSNSLFRTPTPPREGVSRLDVLLRSFHYYACELPALCHNLITLTDEDAAAISPYTSARVHSNPAGVDVDSVPLPGVSERAKQQVLAFAGNYQHPPNVDAVLFLAREVMPELRKRRPNVEIHLFGPGAPREIQELHGRDGIVLRGFVEDLRTELRNATAFVAPLFTGTGQRVKVLEALGAGSVLVASNLAVRGLTLANGEHYYGANTASAFVLAVERILSHPEEALSVARAGRERALAEHGWEASVKKREAIWHSTFAREAS